MARASVVRRLLRRLSFVQVKEINDLCDLAPRKSKEELVSQVVSHYERRLDLLISSDGPYPLGRWNDIAINLGGSPRKSYASVASEIESLLDPVFDDLDGDLTISALRADDVALRTLAIKLRLDRDFLTENLQGVSGNTLLSTYVKDFRAAPVLIVPEPKPPVETLRLASTRSKGANLVEKLSQQWMAKELAEAETVRIAAGFYDKDFISELLLRKPKVRTIQLLFNGLGGRRLKRQLEELKELSEVLCRDDVNVEIKLAKAPGMFHSKLFLFGDSCGATKSLIGSANATNAAFDRNEEILILLSGQNEILERYFDAVWGSAAELGSFDVSARNLIAFFRTGVLYFKPTESISFSLNPFRELILLLSNDDKKRLGAIKLPHAEIDAGIGPFSLRRAVLDETVVSVAEKSTQARIKSWSVETCYGYWVPDALIADWEKIVEGAGKGRRSQYNSLRVVLANTGEDTLFARYREYLDAVWAAFDQVLDFSKFRDKLTRNPFSKDRKAFSAFHERVMRHLRDSEKIERLSRPFVEGSMPEIWDDREVYEDFCSTFFDYVDRFAGRVKRPFVPGRILDQLGIEEPCGAQELMGRMEVYLDKKPWTDGDWARPGPKHPVAL